MEGEHSPPEMSLPPASPGFLLTVILMAAAVFYIINKT